MNGRSMLRLVLVCVLALTAGVASAQVFECIDAKGARQYAHFCPQGTVQQREILKESERGAQNPAGAGGGAPKSIEVRDAEFRIRQQERQKAEAKAAKEKKDAEEAERNCSDARAQIKAIEEGQRLTHTNPATGELVNYSDAERADEIARQRNAASQWCKS